jgi:hypothetical protein
MPPRIKLLSAEALALLVAFGLDGARRHPLAQLPVGFLYVLWIRNRAGGGSGAAEFYRLIKRLDDQRTVRNPRKEAGRTRTGNCAPHAMPP